MKTVFLLFDSLNLRMLNSYGGNYFETTNFNRLSKKSIQFNNHYVGSMPCMPARRDMHSGRLSFLHRAWGPLEPFDNSFPEILRLNNTYTHLVTDHYHYFEDGGATYHNRFNSYDFIRGQERDPWKAMVQPPLEKFREKYHKSQFNLEDREHVYYFYPINSEFIKEEKDEITHKKLMELIEPPYFIPSGTTIYKQIQYFQDNQEKKGFIVNEHGDFLGLVSLEDLLEEIIGEFNTDIPSKLSKIITEDDGWIIDGGISIRDLNKKLNLKLPTDGPITISGLIIEFLENIPDTNTSFKMHKTRFEIINIYEQTIKKVKIYK